MNRSTVGAALVVAVWGLAGCGSNDPGTGASVGSMYVAVVRHLDIATATAPDDDTSTDRGERAVVLVADLNVEPLSLDDQVAVINELDDEYDLRFIDDLDAATEVADDGSLIPTADGTLVAVGTPKGENENDRVILRVETTADDADVDAWQLHLDVDDGIVRVVESVETEPELLVASAAP